MEQILKAYLGLKVLVWLPELLHREKFEEHELKLCCPRCGGRNTKIRGFAENHPGRLVCARYIHSMWALLFFCTFTF